MCSSDLDAGAAAGIENPPGSSALRVARRQGAEGEGARAVHAPTPVVARRRAVLKRITRVWEAVIKGANNGRRRVARPWTTSWRRGQGVVRAGWDRLARHQRARDLLMASISRLRQAEPPALSRLQTFVHGPLKRRGGRRRVPEPGSLPFMTVTASSGSTRVSPQLYDTLPLSSVRQAEQQDRFPDGGELDSLITFFQTGRQRVLAAQRISANAAAIVAKAANRIF